MSLHISRPSRPEITSEDVAELTGRRARDLILVVGGLVLAVRRNFVAAQATRPPSPAQVPVVRLVPENANQRESRVPTGPTTPGENANQREGRVPARGR